MRTIWKETLHVADDVFPYLPQGAKLVDAQMDPQPDNHEFVTMWFDVDDSAPREPLRLRIRGTGHEIPEDAVHLKTVHTGIFVWHIFK